VAKHLPICAKSWVPFPALERQKERGGEGGKKEKKKGGEGREGGRRREGREEEGKGLITSTPGPVQVTSSRTLLA
jgi:hypothetical protein